MLLAELEIRHSRAAVPTRRVALGQRWLPAEPPPGPGGILLGGLVAAHVDAIDDDLLVELLGLIDDLESDRRWGRALATRRDPASPSGEQEAPSLGELKDAFPGPLVLGAVVGMGFTEK